ncbi:hypothetical protein [Plantibacter sp. VKM Ac-2876]|nr:hypothetical protein [Plantibacter sp. VKM Ac-2876]MBF4565126.1 hypothetical protein [Plantibacter sp. VKM Ac-2876]
MGAESWGDRALCGGTYAAAGGTPVVRDYDVPFRFTGLLHKVVVDIVAD